MTSTTYNSVEMRVGQESFDITPLVDEFVWSDSLLRGGFTWSLRLKTNAWNEWWDLMLGREKPVVRFRLKTENREQRGESSTPWKRAVTDWSRAAFSSASSMQIGVHGADRRLELMQKPHLRTFKQASVSDVTTRIAVLNGLTPNTVATRGKRDRWQFREDDWSFLQRSVRGAAAVEGRGDVFLYMDEDALRLVVIQTQQSSVRRHNTTTVDNRLYDYVVQYHGRQIDRMGGASLRGVGFDFDFKTGIVFDVNAAATASYPALAKRVPRRLADGQRTVAVFEDRVSMVESAVHSRWADLGPRYFSLRGETRPDMTIKPNSVIEVVVSDGPARESVFQGRYPCLEVVHRLTSGNLETTVVGYRREAWEGAEQPAGAAAHTVKTQDRFPAEKTTTIVTATVLP